MQKTTMPDYRMQKQHLTLTAERADIYIRTTTVDVENKVGLQAEDTLFVIPQSSHWLSATAELFVLTVFRH